jgi:cytochrome c oxidase subunit 2
VRFNAKRNPTPSRTTHNTLVEVIWTVVPVLILVLIAIPSFAVLTDQETIPDGTRKYLGPNVFSFGEVQVPAPELTIKATGQQWYWDYEYVDEGKSFSSNILPETSSDGSDRPTLKPHQPRLLAVDNELVVPVNTTVKVQVTADPAGVVHAFAVPSFGIVLDAVPGKLNETWFNLEKAGIYYGQCRELCGKDHAFMPIAVRAVTKEQFATWLAALKAGSVTDANKTLPPIT